MQLPGARYIVTVDPENIKAMLATQFEDFGKGKEVHETWKEAITKTILTHFSFSEMGFLQWTVKFGLNLEPCYDLSS